MLGWARFLNSIKGPLTLNPKPQILKPSHKPITAMLSCTPVPKYGEETKENVMGLMARRSEGGELPRSRLQCIMSCVQGVGAWGFRGFRAVGV